jgi:hypothetical protein
MKLQNKPTMPVIGTIVWWLGKNIHTQGTLRQGESFFEAETRAREGFRIINPGERPLLGFCRPEFYPLGH